MKVTEEMILKVLMESDVQWEQDARAALEAVLADVPDVEPFAFPGYPDNPVYLHKCGTVTDLSDLNGDLRAQIEAGECDCESTSPWHRIYVLKGGICWECTKDRHGACIGKDDDPPVGTGGPCTCAHGGAK